MCDVIHPIIQSKLWKQITLVKKSLTSTLKLAMFISKRKKKKKRSVHKTLHLYTYKSVVAMCVEGGMGETAEKRKADYEE